MVWVVLSKAGEFGFKEDKILTETYPLSRFIKCASQWGINQMHSLLLTCSVEWSFFAILHGFSDL